MARGRPSGWGSATAIRIATVRCAGNVELRIPRLRTGYSFPSLTKRRALEKVLTAVIQEACVSGVSRRAMDDLVQAMDRTGISQSEVGRLCEDEPSSAIGPRTIANAEEDVLAYTTFPAQHRAKLHSTNPIERLNGKIKRRTDVVGVFSNEAAIRRLVGVRRRPGTGGGSAARRLTLMERIGEWAIQRSRYMTLETLATVGDDPVVSLPAAQGH